MEGSAIELGPAPGLGRSQLLRALPGHRWGATEFVHKTRRQRAVLDRLCTLASPKDAHRIILKS